MLKLLFLIDDVIMSVRRNFIYNLILTFSSYLFPLLTYPYVSRVLGVIGIGTCNFVDSIIDYFILNFNPLDRVN